MNTKTIYFRQTITILSMSFMAMTANTTFLYEFYDGSIPIDLIVISNISIFLLFGLLSIITRLQLRQAENLITASLRSSNPETIHFPFLSDALVEHKQETNKIIGFLKQQNMKLESQVYEDNLTHLKNRYAFTLDVKDYLKNTPQRDTACLAIIRTTELNRINQERGRIAGDQYLQAIADIIKHVCIHFPASSTYRLSSSDYAIFIKDTLPSVGQILGKELKQLFDNYQLQIGTESIAYTGITFFRSGQEYVKVLARADLALAKSQSETTNGWVIELEDTQDAFEGEQYWKSILSNIIEQKTVNFQTKAITQITPTNPPFSELIPQYYSAEGQVLPHDTIRAMAMRHDLINEIEKLTIIKFIALVKSSKNLNGTRFCLHLSPYSIFKPSFMLWLEQTLSSEHVYCSSMVFAFDEITLDSHQDNSIKMFEMLKRVGARSCIHNFGQGLRSFGLYRELLSNYICLSANLIETLDRDNSSQQFIRTLVEVSHRLQCIIHADGVNSITQREILERLYIDGFYGGYQSSPSGFMLS